MTSCLRRPMVRIRSITCCFFRLPLRLDQFVFFFHPSTTSPNHSHPKSPPLPCSDLRRTKLVLWTIAASHEVYYFVSVSDILWYTLLKRSPRVRLLPVTTDFEKSTWPLILCNDKIKNRLFFLPPVLFYGSSGTRHCVLYTVNKKPILTGRRPEQKKKT